MPGLDGTGPSGEGPLTGRRRGKCGRSKSKQNQEPTVRDSNTDDTVFGRGRRSSSKGYGRREGRAKKRRWGN